VRREREKRKGEEKVRRESEKRNGEEKGRREERREERRNRNISRSSLLKPDL
jgi:hypothetical protein